MLPGSRGFGFTTISSSYERSRTINVGLRQISPASKYCKIVFADDWIFPECLERMVAVGEQHPSVGIVGAYGLQGRQVMWAGLPYPSELVPGREICRKLYLENLYVFGTGTSLLYRASLVRSRDPFYNESNLHADSEVCFDSPQGLRFRFRQSGAHVHESSAWFAHFIYE